MAIRADLFQLPCNAKTDRVFGLQFVSASGIIRERPAMLQGFADQGTQTALSKLRNELGRVSQTTHGKRGDISASLEIFATRIGDIETAIRSARSMKSQAEQTRRMLVDSEGAGRRILDAASSEELKGAFDKQFIDSTNELISRFRELASIDLWLIPKRQGDIDIGRLKLRELQNRIVDARASYDRAARLDGRRQATMQRIAGALSEFAEPEIRGKLGDDGLAVIASLKSYQDILSGFNSVPLIVRSDYSDTLEASDDALGKIEKFKAEMREVTLVIEGEKRLRSRIDQRGRQFLDKPASTQLIELNEHTRRLGAAKIPLSPEPRGKLTDTRDLLGKLESSVPAVMDREEKRFLSREFPLRSGAWVFKFGTDKITDEEWAQASATVEGSEAKYELSVACRRRGPEVLITAFEIHNSDSKRIPWNIDVPFPYRRIQMRIDQDRAFEKTLMIHGYGNQGQIVPAEVESIVRSYRFVFADVFPGEQVEVMTNYPAQFRRLCELLIGPGS